MNKVTELAIKDIHPKWKVLLNTEYQGRSLVDILDSIIVSIISKGGELIPDTPAKILRAFHLDPDLIKVVIIGQDPYPKPGVATGLAFACKDEFQPNLEVILRELQKEYSFEEFNGSLEQWESQGIMLLNASLSCEKFKPGSHTKLWEPFIAGVMNILNDMKITRSEMTSIVFVFLGASAKLFHVEVSEKLHYKIMRHHPVAEKYGDNKFEGFFIEVNKCLEESGQTKINWI